MTTMTAEDLRKLITPAVEADLKAAGLWPERVDDGEKHPLRWINIFGWLWCGLCPANPDDAHAQIERALVEWALDRGYGLVKCEDRYHVGPQVHVAPSLLHALLAAFAGRSRTAPTGEKEGA